MKISMTTNHRLFFYCNFLLPKKEWLIAILVMLFSTYNVSAQQTEIVTGKVTSEKDAMPLPGVNVTVKGTTTAVSTGFDGQYSIHAKPTDVLLFTYVGYEPQQITIGSRTKVDLVFRDNINKLNEIVVIGYGTQKKSDLTGSVSVVNVASAKKTVTYDMAKMLQGQVPGVTVQSSGEPGAFVNIKIRGIASFNNTNPLFVIDGMIVDSPYDFAPGEIESMQVLKDASSAAIYGVRGANGVIIVTTKKGKAGQIQFTYKNLFGLQNVAKRMDVTNRVQYQQITNAAMANAKLPLAPANDPTNANYVNNIDTDWQAEAFRTGTVTNHSLTFTGGAEALGYSMNIDYFNNSSYFKTPQDYTRYATTLNFYGKKAKFKYGGKLGYTQSNKEIFNDFSGGAPVMGSLVTAIPTVPVYDENRLGGYGGTTDVIHNNISMNIIGYNNLVTNTTDRNRFIGNVWGEYEIIPGLKYKIDASYDKTFWYDTFINPPSNLGSRYEVTEKLAELRNTNGNFEKTFFNNFLSYEKSIGKHKFDVLAGLTQEIGDYYQLITKGIEFTEDELMIMKNAATVSGDNYVSRVTGKSYLSRLNYNYDDLYLLQANFRQDKSSLFSEKNSTANFYSFSAGWKISNESFLKDNLPDWLNTIKARGGYGILGNNTIPAYAYTTTINPYVPYTWGGATNGQLATGGVITELKDENLHWEKTATANVALELGLFNNNLQFIGEYFAKKSTDILYKIPFPSSSGSAGSYLTNAGDVENKGFEFTLSYNNHENAFKYGISANLGTLENKVTKIGTDDAPIYAAASKTEVGRSMGELYGFQVEGIFQTQAEVDAAPKQEIGKTGPGDIKFKDQNGDKVINDLDRTFLGAAIPKYTYGLNLNAEYKNFEATMFWQGAGGNYVYNAVYRDLMRGSDANFSTDYLNYWTPTNTNTDVPKPAYQDPSKNNRDSDRFVEKGDYIKLQTLEIAYNIPLTKVTFIQKARVFINGQNLLTITDYKGFDPDFNNAGLFDRGYDYGSLPNPRTFSMGVQLDF
jgi:TonB-linked SusC/RagA family outer membrane protein